MNDIATHMRITGLTVANEDVDSRGAAANALKVTWSKQRDVRAIVLKAQDIASALTTSRPSSELGEEVQAAVQKRASAFLYEDRPLEVGIVAGMAVQNLMKNSSADLSGWLVADVWAAALWSALSFQPPLEEPKREGLRAQVLDAARARCIDGAEVARTRIPVPEFGKPKDGDASLAPQFEGLTKATVDALRRNSALDREELDFLWWALGDRSRLLKKRLSGLEEPIRLIAAAIDASSLMRRLPCDVHRELVLRNVDADPELTLAELLTSLGDARAALSAPFQQGLVSGAPIAFPVLSAIVSGKAAKGTAAAMKRKTSEWAERVLLEATLDKLSATGPRTL